MAEAPYTQKIVDRIADLVRSINTENGFRTNVGQIVSTEPVQLDDDQALGAVVYLGGINPTDRSTARAPERKLDVVVDAYVGVQLENAQALQHEVYDDIESLFSGLTLTAPDGQPAPGGLALELGGATFIPRSDDMATAGVQVVISITYRPRAARK